MGSGLTNALLVVLKVLELYRWILIARAICSWIPGANWHNQPLKLLYDITEPVLMPIRRVIPPIGMLDISALLLFLLLGFLINLLAQMVYAGSF